MFFAKKNKEQKIIIFDLRSSSVAASVVAINKESLIPKILFSRREHYYFTETPNPEIFIHRAHIALKKLINEVSNFKSSDNELEHKVSAVHVLYGAPWYKPSFTDAYYEQTKEFTVTSSLISKIVQNITKSSLTGQAHLEIMEKNIASILINGYETEGYLGKKTKDLKLSFYLSKIATETKNEIEKIIQSKINTENIFHRSHLNVIHSFLKNNFHSVNNYILIDVGGEITEITTVQNSFFRKYITIPMGTHFFSRKLAEKSKYDLHTARSHLNMLVSDNIHPKLRKKAESVIKEIKEEYLAVINDIFTKEKIINPPSKIFIISDTEIGVLIKYIFESAEGYAGALKIAKKPDITTFNKNTFDGVCQYGPYTENDNLISIFSNFVTMNNN